jgi:mRNA interferase MazF
MKRGELYFIKTVRSEEGIEQEPDRPAVIISNNKINEYSEGVSVAYMTIKPKQDLPTHVITRSVLSSSTILCEQIATVSKRRVAERIGELTDSEMKAVDAALAIWLGIDVGAVPYPEPALSSERIADLLREAIKLQAERNLYKKLYENLLDHMKGATNQ